MIFFIQNSLVFKTNLFALLLALVCGNIFADDFSRGEIERAASQHLSEEILRTMVTSAEHIPAEIIETNEGQEDLAAEIKLRSENKTESASNSNSKISKKREEKEAKTKDPATEEVAEISKEAKTKDAVTEEVAEISKEAPASTEEAPESTEEVSTEA